MIRLIAIPLCWVAGFFAGNSLVKSQENNTGAPKWHTRYKAAVEEAAAQKKDLLIVFTASKWVEICKIFEADILSQPAFASPTSKKYALLKLEYPKNNQLPKELAAEYELLRGAYRVRGFPTVLVTDAKGKPFGMNGYQPVSATDYARVMLVMVKGRVIRDDAFAKAAKLEGVEKAKALAAGLPDLPGTLAARYYRKEMEEIIKLDPKNKTKMTGILRGHIADVDYANELQQLASEVQYEKMIQLTDSYIKEHKLEGERLQKALMNRLSVQQKQKNTAGAIKTLLEVVSAGPESSFGKSAKKMLDRLRAQKIQDQLVK